MVYTMLSGDPAVVVLKPLRPVILRPSLSTSLPCAEFVTRLSLQTNPSNRRVESKGKQNVSQAFPDLRFVDIGLRAGCLGGGIVLVR